MKFLPYLNVIFLFVTLIAGIPDKNVEFVENVEFMDNVENVESKLVKA